MEEASGAAARLRTTRFSRRREPSLMSGRSSRNQEIASQWYEAIASTSFTPHRPDEIRCRVGDLTDQISLFLGECRPGLEHARSLGRQFAELRFLQPDALENTLAVLGQQLLAGLPARRLARLQPRLAVLLGALAGGFFAAAREAILDEQEQIRSALLASQRDMQVALQGSEARYRAIFAYSALGIALLDNQGQLIEANPALCRILGYDTDELRRLDFASLTHPDDLRLTLGLFQQLLAGQRDHYQVDKRYLRSDGQTVWARVTMSLVRSDDRLAPFAIGLVEDVSARQRMESELAEAHRRLAEGREDERILLARELHDGAVQELIGVQMQLARLSAARGEVSEPSRLQAIEASVLGVVDSLRAIVRELRPSSLVPFGLASAIRSHVGHLAESQAGSKLSIDLALDEDQLPAPVRLALFRVYQAAIANVVRHAHAAHVHVRFKASADHVTLEVCDDGRGCVAPPNWLDLARQGHFGLLGAEERARSIGGRLELISAPGEGTLVRVVAAPPFEP